MPKIRTNSVPFCVVFRTSFQQFCDGLYLLVFWISRVKKGKIYLRKRKREQFFKKITLVLFQQMQLSTALSNSSEMILAYTWVVLISRWSISFETCSILIPLFKAFVAKVWRLRWKDSLKGNSIFSPNFFKCQLASLLYLAVQK